MKRINIILVTLVLIVGMVGCDGSGGDNNGDTLPQNLEIYDWYDLDAIRDNLSGNHTLMNNLDSTTAGYEELASPIANQGRGWEPVGFWGCPFLGKFDGQGYEITDLFIDSIIYGTDEYDCIGIFGCVETGAFIENLGMVNATVTGYEQFGDFGYLGYLGCLIGFNAGTVSDCYASGIVTGNLTGGGLIGWNAGPGVIYNSYFAGMVSGFDWGIGGLIGENSGTVDSCHSTGSVAGVGATGGLLGWNYGNVRNCYSSSNSIGYSDYQGVGGLVGNNGGTLVNSYATGNVTGALYIGGLVGLNTDIDGVINNCYATGCVIGEYYTGGLAGRNGGTLIDSYATGSVVGSYDIGGLVGDNAATIRNCYASGNVTGDYYVGGLVGANIEEGTVDNSFWDTETSGQSTSDGGIGKNTAEMKDITTFSAATWNIIAVDNSDLRNTYYNWNIVDGVTYPFLSWQ